MKYFFVSIGALFAIAAPSTTANAKTYAHLVQVMRCEPSLNASTFVGPGWVPGYYPAGPYYWPSVYGFRYYEPRVRTTDPQLGIDYTNVSNKVMKDIEFGLVANGNLVAEVKDVGTFSPGAEIKHTFGISRNVFPIQTALAQCVPLKITFADGTKWRSRRLPALRQKIGI